MRRFTWLLYIGLMAKYLALAVLLIVGQSHATTVLEGRVIRVADDDTLTLLLPDKRQVQIRLGENDAPESGQPYGNKSKAELNKLIHSQEVTVEVQDTDRYGRTVGRVFINDLDVNREMVRTGAAWVFRQYLKDRSLLEVEDEARDAGRGLWATTEAQSMPPREWRRQGGQEGAPKGCNIRG